MATPSPGLKGDTGILRIGMRLQRTERQPWFLDVGVDGYAGRREGIGAHVDAGWWF